MSKKELLTAALVASMALPGVGLAAIDDKGMAYVSAAEGFSGRIQMRWGKSKDNGCKEEDPTPYWPSFFGETDCDSPSNTFEKLDKGTLGLETLRLYLDGNMDLGGSLKSTYHTEIRNDGSSGLKLHAYDIGITGAFGSLNVGRLDGVTDRMVPSGSLDTVAGSKAESITSNPDDHGLRYESPSFFGFKLGFSAKVDGTGGPAGSVDGYNAAISYEHPIGLKLGFGIEDKKGLGIYGSKISPPLGDDSDPAGYPTGNYDVDQDGYRFGVHYSLAGFTFGYEHRKMNAFDAFSSTCPSTIPGATNTCAEAIEFRRTGQDFNTWAIITAFDSPGASYKADRIGVRYKLDRITASVNYSKEKTYPEYIIDTVTGIPGYDPGDGPRNFPLHKAKPTRTVLGADLSYALGSKSRLAVGLVSEELEDVDGYIDSFDTGKIDFFTYEKSNLEKLILDYQVNF